MTTYIVTQKSDGIEVYRYLSDAPVEWSGMAFATHDHTPQPHEIEPAVPSAPKTWTKLKFERKFSDAEWDAGQAFNASFETLEQLSDAQKLTIRRGLNDYKIALDISSVDPGVINLLGLYELFGVIAPGRAQEILND